MIRVLVVDDSALVRQMLTQLLNVNPDIEVVGTATDPYHARQKIKDLRPDVITLDVEMPRMDGLTFLSNLMRLHPMPVVMISSLTKDGADVTFRALEIGAVDFVAKPSSDISSKLMDYAEEIQNKVIAAAGISKDILSQRSRKECLRQKNLLKVNHSVVDRYNVDEFMPNVHVKHYHTTDKVIAIGSSTGGTVALAEILEKLPKTCHGIVVSQHIPVEFSSSFAKRLNELSRVQVVHAEDGQQIMMGHCYISPGDRHLTVVKSGAKYIIRLSDGIPVNRHKPSVDVMFRSVSQAAGPNALGIILTGMGADGARGLKEMRDAGAYTIAQDEESSVVWGMPGASVKLGGVEEIVPLDHISNIIESNFKGNH